MDCYCLRGCRGGDHLLAGYCAAFNFAVPVEFGGAGYRVRSVGVVCLWRRFSEVFAAVCAASTVLGTVVSSQLFASKPEAEMAAPLAWSLHADCSRHPSCSAVELAALDAAGNPRAARRSKVHADFMRVPFEENREIEVCITVRNRRRRVVIRASLVYAVAERRWSRAR